ncbi:MAG: RNA methyltransferase [Thermomicrobiales bacterium]|nr:RNA methyltransferase [Thermomicrobiales bacterium]
MTFGDPITSTANPTLAYVRALLTRRDRRAAERAFVVEGRRAVADAIAAGARPTLLLLRAGSDASLSTELPPETPVRLVAARSFDALSDVVHAQGVLAVLPFPDLPIDPAATPLALVVDRIRDPGNLGTLLRAAAGAGATVVYLAPETVDPFNPKVVRAAMGAHHRIPLRLLTEEATTALRAAVPLRVVARADAPLPYDALDWREPAAVIIGSEASGVSGETAALATNAVAIPLTGGVESLNAAVAGAVILFEAARQRRVGG